MADEDAETAKVGSTAEAVRRLGTGIADEKRPGGPHPRPKWREARFRDHGMCWQRREQEI